MRTALFAFVVSLFLADAWAQTGAGAPTMHPPPPPPSVPRIVTPPRLAHPPPPAPAVTPAPAPAPGADSGAVADGVIVAEEEDAEALEAPSMDAADDATTQYSPPED